MATDDDPILTKQQLAQYEELGFLHSIPILSPAEVADYRVKVEKTCQAIGGRATRLDGLHLFFRWAWALSTHPRLLNCLAQLLGATVLMPSPSRSYRHAASAAEARPAHGAGHDCRRDPRAPSTSLRRR